jgi:putative nucleotidyltransferase with HDIG domain
MAVAAALCAGFSFFPSHPHDLFKFLGYLAAGVLVSSFKVGLPGIEGTISVNFLFTLLGVLELSLPETLSIALCGTVAQFFWKPARRLKPVQMLFNISQITVSSTAAFAVYHLTASHIPHGSGTIALLAAALTYFACNTASLSTIIGLTEEKSPAAVWKNSFLWSFPHYIVGATLAGMVGFLNRTIGWQSSLLVLPPIYLMYRSYQLHLGKLDADKKNAEKLSNLHLRTIEALALAIEAKDKTTGAHLQRVRVYAMELARELGLTEDETEALRAASVLHDIGKLAVPEHIISKPGKLTAEEFEKMKIHPIVGAEILEQVQFPYPVTPIVRAHHEKWDGTGYPYGLKQTEIPIGARILAAVDCLDALASHRQYRRALPLDEAMNIVESESGKAFDPQIVALLRQRYIDLEALANQHDLAAVPKLSTDIKIERGAAPDAGLAESSSTVRNPDSPLLPAFAKASRDELSLHGLCQESHGLLDASDILALLSLRMQRLVPHDSIVVYLVHGEYLTAGFIAGENSQIFSQLRIPFGAGLAGWVAENRLSILNANPSVEHGYPDAGSAEDASAPGCKTFRSLKSALALPLENKSRVVGVLVLHREAQDAFTKSELNLAETLVSRIGPALEHAQLCKATAVGAS